MIAALQFDLKAKPGKKNEFHFLLGLTDSVESAIKLKKKCLNKEFFKDELKKIENYTKSNIHKVFINTPDNDINTMANIWLKRQVDLGKTWARTYTKGFRDIMQDVTAFVSLDPAIIPVSNNAKKHDVIVEMS